MKRLLMAVLVSLVAASAARAGTPTSAEIERERRRREAARRLIEASAEFRNFWSQGEQKWRQFSSATYAMPAATLPAVPDPGAKAKRIDELVAKFVDAPIAEKMEARNELADIGEAATAALAKALQAEDVGSRSSASIVLKKIGYPAIGAILPLCDVKDRRVRGSAIDVVTRIAKPEALGALVAKIESAENADCRSGLLKAVKACIGPKDLDTVLGILGSCRDRELKRAMAGAASTSGDLKALPPLIALAASTEPLFKQLGAYGVQILSQRCTRDQVPMLYAAFNSSQEPVKTALAKALQRLSGRNPAGEPANDWRFFVYVRMNNVDWPPPRN